MRIGAAEAKRTDAGNPFCALPRDVRGGNLKRFMPSDVRIWLMEVQMGRNFLMLQRQNQLDEPRNARRRL